MAVAVLCASITSGYGLSRWKAMRHLTAGSKMVEQVLLTRDDEAPRGESLAEIATRLRRVERTQGAALGSQLGGVLQKQTSEQVGVGRRPETEDAQREERERFGRYFSELDRLREAQPADRD